MSEDFAEFEHKGWQRVARKYDSVWSRSTTQFIPHLLDAAQVEQGISLLDVGCGPGYVAAAAAKRGTHSVGLDFSAEMVVIAREMFPKIEFREGDAQKLPFDQSTFDRVVANFALLHLSEPERAAAEALRILKPTGKFAFTVWAPPAENPYAALVDAAIEAHANLSVQLPAGPSHYLFNGKEEFRSAMGRAGFDESSMIFKLVTIEWEVPTARYPFDAELNAGVRTAGLLARQTPAALEKIREAMEAAVQPYFKEGRFRIPKSAYVVAVTKAK